MQYRVWVSLLMVSLVVSLGCDQKIVKGNLSDYARFGRSIGAFGTTTIVGSYQENNQAGAAYVFATPGGALGLEARLVPSDPAAGDQFGDSVAVYGDTAAVAATVANLPGAVRAGAVYVFQRSSSGWTQQAKLSPPSPQAWQAFGVSVALEGNTLVVGSPHRDVSGMTDSGAAYVYQRAGNVWTLASTLYPPSNIAQDHFGGDVAIYGDRIFVGATGRDWQRYSNTGAVFVYGKIRSTWGYSQTLLASDRAPQDMLGVSLAVTVVDGMRTLIAGASGADVASAANAGAAYVFREGQSGTFSQVQKVTAADPTTQASFGTDVAAFGTRMVVGASTLNVQRGAGYVFEHAGGAFSQVAKLVPEDVAINDATGNSVGISVLGVLLGATGADVDPAGTDAGAVHLFTEGSGWREVHRFSAAERTDGDRFSQDVSHSGDFAAVASDLHVDVLRRDAQFWSLVQQIPNPASYTASNVALDDDRLVIFLRRSIGNVVPVGRMEIYGLNATGVWEHEQTLIPDLISASFPGESANTASLSLRGDRLALGAPRFNGGDGRVIVYERTGSDWVQTQILGSAWAAQAIDQNFGRWVAVNETTLAIAEVPNINEPTSVPKHGRIHVYDLNAGSFTSTETITAPAPVDVDFFGRGLALSSTGLLAVVGEQQRIRVYSRNGGSYTVDWETTLVGLDSYPDLAFDLNRLAVGIAGANHSSLTNAGEVRVFLQQPDASWVLEQTMRAGDAADAQRFGSRVSFDSGRLLVGTDAHSVGLLYSF